MGTLTNHSTKGPVVGTVLEEIVERHSGARELVHKESFEFSLQEMSNLSELLREGEGQATYPTNHPNDSSTLVRHSRCFRSIDE